MADLSCLGKRWASKRDMEARGRMASHTSPVYSSPWVTLVLNNDPRPGLFILPTECCVHLVSLGRSALV